LLVTTGLGSSLRSSRANPVREGRDEGGGCGVGRKGNARKQASTFSPSTSRLESCVGRGKVSRGFVTPESELLVKTRRETPPVLGFLPRPIVRNPF